MKGTKYEGHDWCNILSGLLINIGIIRISSEHGFYSWKFNDDDIYKVQLP